MTRHKLGTVTASESYRIIECTEAKTARLDLLAGRINMTDYGAIMREHGEHITFEQETGPMPEYTVYAEDGS